MRWKKAVRLAKKALIHVVLLVFALIVAYPMLWLVNSSFKSQDDLLKNVWSLPEEFLFSNYRYAWDTSQMDMYFLNSVIVSVVTVAGVVIFSYMAAYAFARMRFAGSMGLMTACIALMMVPVQVIVIGLYKTEADLGILNSLLGLILPYIAGGLPFSIFWTTAYLQSIPKEIDEAAFIDGASRMHILFLIIMPLSIPAMVTTIIFRFMSTWNDFFLPLILVYDPARRTIPLGLFNFSNQYGVTQLPPLFAAIIISIIPLLLIYIVFQRYFVGGAMTGAIKA